MARRIAPSLTVAALGVALLGLSACNTIAGAGKDTSALGHDVTSGATSAQGTNHDKTGTANN